MRPHVVALLVAAWPAGLSAQGQVVDHERVRRFGGQVVTVEGPEARATGSRVARNQVYLDRSRPSHAVLPVIPPRG